MSLIIFSLVVAAWALDESAFVQQRWKSGTLTEHTALAEEEAGLVQVRLPKTPNAEDLLNFPLGSALNDEAQYLVANRMDMVKNLTDLVGRTMLESTESMTGTPRMLLDDVHAAVESQGYVKEFVAMAKAMEGRAKTAATHLSFDSVIFGITMSWGLDGPNVPNYGVTIAWPICVKSTCTYTDTVNIPQFGFKTCGMFQGGNHFMMDHSKGEEGLTHAFMVGGGNFAGLAGMYFETGAVNVRSDKQAELDYLVWLTTDFKTLSFFVVQFVVAMDSPAWGERLPEVIGALVPQEGKSVMGFAFSFGKTWCEA